MSIQCSLKELKLKLAKAHNFTKNVSGDLGCRACFCTNDSGYTVVSCAP